MTPQPPPGEPPADAPDPAAAGRFHSAWLAHTRQELETPALAVREYIQLLVAALGERGRDPVPDRLGQDLAKLQSYGDRLAAEVHRFLASAEPAESDPQRLADLRRAIRHDLRSAAGFVVSLCEAVQEEWPALFPQGADSGLGRVAEAARRVLDLIERLVHFSPGAHQAEQPPADRELVQTLRRLSSLSGSREAGPTGRILLVDDSADNRDLYAAILAAQGHTVVCAADGAAALEVLARPGEAIDAVLLDVMMPGVSGLEVLDRIKAQPHFLHLPVVLMSALGEEEVMVSGLLRGAEDYLRRPVSGALLRARLGACLEKKRLRDREQGYQRRIDELLHALFPPGVVAELKEKGTVPTRRHERVGVMFVDAVGFTPFCEAHKDDPDAVVEVLRNFVGILERTAAAHGVQKIKTIGDAFLATAGLLRPDPDPVATLVRCAAEMILQTRRQIGWELRVGIHLGALVAGVVGETQFSYDVWGDTVNMAARLEASGRPGLITLSGAARAGTPVVFPAQPRDAALRGIGPAVVWDVAPGWEDPGRLARPVNEFGG